MFRRRLGVTTAMQRQGRVGSKACKPTLDHCRRLRNYFPIGEPCTQSSPPSTTEPNRRRQKTHRRTRLDPCCDGLDQFVVHTVAAVAAGIPLAPACCLWQSAPSRKKQPCMHNPGCGPPRAEHKARTRLLDNTSAASRGKLPIAARQPAHMNARKLPNGIRKNNALTTLEAIAALGAMWQAWHC